MSICPGSIVLRLSMQVDVIQISNNFQNEITVHYMQFARVFFTLGLRSNDFVNYFIPQKEDVCRSEDFQRVSP